MAGLGLVEFGAERSDSGGVNGIGLAMELDEQFAVGQIGANADGCMHEASNETAGIVGAFEFAEPSMRAMPRLFAPER